MEMAIVKFAHGIMTPEVLVKSVDVNYPMLSTAVLQRLSDREVPNTTFD